MENQISQGNIKHQVYFHGKSGEYFSIWIVNLLLTVITLGIYSAWATVRRRRYFYGNTELNGDRFDYHAQPIEILKGRLLVIGCIIIFYVLLFLLPLAGIVALLVFLALVPRFIIGSWRYQAIMSSYRGIRFNYQVQIGRAYWALLFCPLLLIIGFYLACAMLVVIGASAESTTDVSMLGIVSVVVLVPLFAAINGIITTLQYDLYVNNLQFGQSSFVSELKRTVFIKFALFSLLIFLPFLLIALLLAGSFFALLIQFALMGGMSDQMFSMLLAGNIINLVLMFLVLLLGALVCNSYIIVAHRNYLFKQTQLQGEVKLHSSMQTLPYMGLLITNSLITLFSLGFAAPVAEIRHARYLAQSTQVEGDLSLLTVASHQETANSAIAEEAVQMLDLGSGF
ncbi:DUF898 domain-containing protein [Serratia sp. S1B]|nr:DUF898 domain-containing protein [Serratia sp. S1B]